MILVYYLNARVPSDRALCWIEIHDLCLVFCLTVHEKNKCNACIDHLAFYIFAVFQVPTLSPGALNVFYQNFEMKNLMEKIIYT